jgi:hypothetical protein
MKFELSHLKSALSRYVISICIVVAAFLLYKGISKLVGADLPTYILFYPAVIFTALFGGFSAVLLATLIAARRFGFFLRKDCRCLPYLKPSAW